MNHDPILATKTLPADPNQGRKHPHTFRVEGGLHYITGNTLPYFSLTYTEHRQGFPNQEESGGAGHESILQHFPQFADLAALHLSDMDGAPLHAVGNARYHAGQGKYGKRDRAALQRHLRCVDNSVDNLLCNADKGDWAQFDADVEAMRPRWQAEAVTCILLHGLKVYGDPWDGAPLPTPPTDCREGKAMPRTCHDALPGDWQEDSPHGANCAQRVISAAECTCGKADALAAPEPTYVDRWGITSTATPCDSNPNMDDASGDMDHWRVTLRLGRRKMTAYYSMGSAHAGREPTAQDVIDCIAQDAGSMDSAQGFEDWARDLGYDPDSRSAHHTYMVCKRQGERLQKFLGADHYAELMGEE